MDNHDLSSKPIPRFWYFSVFLNFFLLFILFLFLSQTRNVDGDEGLYLEAARLVAQGKELYFDFFYQQMPLLPYLYAGWMKIFGFDFFVGRWLSALLTALTGGIFFFYVARKTRSLFLMNFCALIFFANGLILAWAPVVKTHPLSLLGLTSSAILLLLWREKQAWWLVALAAVGIGLGVNSRLTLGPFIPIYLIYILLKSRGHVWRDGVLFILIVALTSFPTFFYFFSDPQLFWKYNMLYHTQVYPGVVGGSRRLSTAQNLFLQAQMILLLLAAQGTILLLIKRNWRKFLDSDESFISLLLIFFIAIHMASAEPYTQYFVTMVPLLVMLCVPIFQWIWAKPKILSLPVLLLFSIFYLGSARATMDFEVSSMLSHRPEWSLRNIQKTVQVIEETLKPGEACLTWWPGYAFMAGCRTVPGMENHMRNYGVQKLNQQEMSDYKMLSDEDLFEILKEGKYRVLVDGVYHIESPLYKYIREQIQENYIPAGMGVLVQYDKGWALFDLVYSEAFERSVRYGKRKRAPRI
ncbi:MAG: glycosyltransferase family 39 protein [bacterium]|nr:glycosyltransferase family 39 protein [bacterium]